ncbi:ATP-binding protein [Paenibacillus aurantiacus]|uniref:histidine kinase n=1 Tax=Paenibacillus aurantiacus TaxID=1936118 RepID=A0ABV5KVG9_9BACL
MRLQTKLILLLCSLLAFVTVSLGGIFYVVITTLLEKQIGARALTVAETIAVMPDIRDAFDDPVPSNRIQPIAESARKKTGAQYIVIGNREGIRYAHPIPSRIGGKMVGGDNGPVLEGRSIISRATGSMGPSLRGKAPVFGDDGTVIGIVSVGFLTDEIDTIADTYQTEVLTVSCVALLIGVIGSVLIARSVRRSIHGLEPKEIGELYTEKEAILESIREGIIAVDHEGRVTLANRYANRLLHIPDNENVVGRQIEELIPNTALMEVVRSGIPQSDRELIIGDQEVIANRVPIRDFNQRVTGAVSSFRSKSELYRLAEELSQVKRFAESLRAQTHEFSNKLYVISGLIQLESYQEAIELISKEADVHQNLIQFVMREVPDPVIGGLIIGKYNHASELRIAFHLNGESSFRDIPAHVDRGHLVTIIGNLVDNAMDAALERHPDQEGEVALFLTDLGEDLIIECEDNGAGIPDELGETIFRKGFSSKQGEHRGIGLSLVEHAVSKLNGYITYDRSPMGGAHFTVAIPKRKAAAPKEHERHDESAN